MVRRKKEGLTQDELGQRLGVTGTYISYIENGKSDGSQKFWDKLKKLWNIPNSEMENYREKE
jgi:transcriptional regulator with XRE-family HTH domain